MLLKSIAQGRRTEHSKNTAVFYACFLKVLMKRKLPEIKLEQSTKKIKVSEKTKIPFRDFCLDV